MPENTSGKFMPEMLFRNLLSRCTTLDIQYRESTAFELIQNNDFLLQQGYTISAISNFKFTISAKTNLKNFDIEFFG